MSVIKTWKCDGCGAISRQDRPELFLVEVSAVRAPKRELFGPSRETVRFHVCSLECIGDAVAEDRAKIEALEVEA